MKNQKQKRYAVVNQGQCVGCGSCIKVCPKEAITVPMGVYAQVDLERCIGCGLCAKVCPASVIAIEMKLEQNEEKTGYDK